MSDCIRWCEASPPTMLTNPCWKEQVAGAAPPWHWQHSCRHALLHHGSRVLHMSRHKPLCCSSTLAAAHVCRTLPLCASVAVTLYLLAAYAPLSAMSSLSSLPTAFTVNSCRWKGGRRAVEPHTAGTGASGGAARSPLSTARAAANPRASTALCGRSGSRATPGAHRRRLGLPAGDDEAP